MPIIHFEKHASCWVYLFFLAQIFLLMHNIPTAKAALNVPDQNTISSHTWQFNTAYNAWTLQLLNIPSNAFLLVFVCPDLQCLSTSMQVATCAEIKQLGEPITINTNVTDAIANMANMTNTTNITQATAEARQEALIAATNRVRLAGATHTIANNPSDSIVTSEARQQALIAATNHVRLAGIKHTIANTSAFFCARKEITTPNNVTYKYAPQNQSNKSSFFCARKEITTPNNVTNVHYTHAQQWRLITSTISEFHADCLPPIEFSGAATVLQPNQIILFNNASTLQQIGYAHTQAQFELRMQVISVNTYDSSNIFSVQQLYMTFNLTIPQSTSQSVISVQNECASRFLRTPFRGILIAQPQLNGMIVCLWTCQEGYIRQPWNAVPQSSLIPAENYSYTPSCVPLPTTFVAVEFEYNLYVNVQVLPNSTTVDFSEEFYNELDVLAEEMKQSVVEKGFEDPIVVLKIKLSMFDTNQFHEILYANSAKQSTSNSHEYYSVDADDPQMRRRLLSSHDVTERQAVTVEGVVIATGETVNEDPQYLYETTADVVESNVESFEFESVTVEGSEPPMVKAIVRNAQVSSSSVSGSSRSQAHAESQATSATLLTKWVPRVASWCLDFLILGFVVKQCTQVEAAS